MSIKDVHKRNKVSNYSVSSRILELASPFLVATTAVVLQRGRRNDYSFH